MSRLEAIRQMAQQMKDNELFLPLYLMTLTEALASVGGPSFEETLARVSREMIAEATAEIEAKFKDLGR